MTSHGTQAEPLGWRRRAHAAADAPAADAPATARRRQLHVQKRHRLRQGAASPGSPERSRRDSASVLRPVLLDSRLRRRGVHEWAVLLQDRAGDDPASALGCHRGLRDVVSASPRNGAAEDRRSRMSSVPCVIKDQPATKCRSAHSSSDKLVTSYLIANLYTASVYLSM